jgi:hypothetical protein
LLEAGRAFIAGFLAGFLDDGGKPIRTINHDHTGQKLLAYVGRAVGSE